MDSHSRLHNSTMKKPKLQLADALGHEVADKRLDILRRIGDVGSISEAARDAGVSYKAAWQAIDTLSNLACTPLLERTVGGSGGGGARLTPAGLQLLQAASLLSQARFQVLSQLSQGQGNAEGTFPRVNALGLRTSMRNQLRCSVAAIKTQGQAILVELRLPDGTPLYSRITKESAELLALRPGLEVLALCKATAVTMAAFGEETNERNLLTGTTQRASRSINGGEVSLSLDGGMQLVGFARPASRLKLGGKAVAHVDESSVVIALAI